MPPKTTGSALQSDGKPARKRTRTRTRRGGRGRGRGAQLDLSSSSSSDDDSSSDGEQQKPKAGKVAAAASAKVDLKGKGRAAGEGSSSSDSSSESDGSSGEEGDKAGNDSGDESDASSSSSSSSFLTTSVEDDDDDDNQVRQSSSSANGAGLTNGHGPDERLAGTSVRQRAPSPTRQPSPPLFAFGPQADELTPANYRAVGKPILWGLLPGDADAPPSEQEARLAEQQKAQYLRFREFYVSRMIERFGSSLDTIRTKEGQDLVSNPNRLQLLIQAVSNGADTFTSSVAEGIWRTRDAPAEKGEREVVLETLAAHEDSEVAHPATEEDAEML